jgi:hypothetical protein
MTSSKTNYSNNSGNFNTYNGTTFNIKSLELNITKKLESSIESAVLMKLGIKFDANMLEINRSLDKLVDTKVRKYLIENDFLPRNQSDTAMITYTGKDIENIISENIELIIKENIKKFPILQEISEMSLGLTQDEPLVSSIPKVFELKEHVIIDPDTKYETIVVTADMLNYLSDSLKMGAAELEEKIRFCEEENSANLNKRIDILIKLRNQWIQLLRSIYKHPKLQELFNSNAKLDEASGKSITNKVSDILGTYIQKYIFGVSKLYCEIQNHGEVGEFHLLNSIGIINN